MTFFIFFTKPETDLERQVAELLESSENNLKDQKLLTPAELKAVETMNLDQVKNIYNLSYLCQSRIKFDKS